MDYKKVLRLHFVNRLSIREIAESCGDCGKTSVGEFLKRFRECPELSYPLPKDGKGQTTRLSLKPFLVHT